MNSEEREHPMEFHEETPDIQCHRCERYLDPGEDFDTWWSGDIGYHQRKLCAECAPLRNIEVCELCLDPFEPTGKVGKQACLKCEPEAFGLEYTNFVLVQINATLRKAGNHEAVTAIAPEIDRIRAAAGRVA